MKKLFIVCALAVLISGCAVVGTSGVQIKPEQLAGFQKGVTSESDVIQALGKPTSLMTSSDGTKTLSYSFARVKAGGFSGSDMQSNVTFIMFDDAGKMLSYNVTESNQNTRAGYSSGSPEK
jgi:hypothetical protein